MTALRAVSGGVAAVLAAGVALPLLAAGALPAAPRTTPATATGAVPALLAAAYRDAVSVRCPGLPWAVLAAVGQVESGHAQGRSIDVDGRVHPPIVGPALDGREGRRAIVDSDSGRLDGDTVWDRAVGPMQFIPTTWTAHGLDASGDGTADPHNVHDATHSAAAYLCAAGAPQDLPGALHAYNQSSVYVAEVLAAAEQLTSRSPPLPLVDGDGLIGHPNVTLTARARADLEAGVVDGRVVALLAAVAQTTPIAVSVFRSGHSQYVAGTTRTSLHWWGQAADVYAVAGQTVHAGNQPARQLVAWMAELPAGQRPDEVGSPWPEFSRLPGFFSDADHQGHLHVGYR